MNVMVADLKDLVAFIEYANSVRNQRDGEFCAGKQEYEESDQEFASLILPLGIVKNEDGAFIPVKWASS